MFCLGFNEGADFALESGRGAGVGADLDEHGVSRSINGVEVHFISLRRAEVMNLASTAEQFDVRWTPKSGPEAKL